MKKKINELCGNDLKQICKKHFNYQTYDTCKNCPLQIDSIHCVKGLVEEQSQLAEKLVQVNELLENCMGREIEVEETIIATKKG